ncbi:MAG: DUF5677 domain-containing protein [Bacteriovoracaceae bacterium]
MSDGSSSLAYWNKAESHLQNEHRRRVDPQFDNYLCQVAGFSIQLLDELDRNATQNQKEIELIKGLLPFFLDSAKVLAVISREMSLITTSNQARHLFEVFLIVKFIFKSGNVQQYADLYRKFAVVNQLRAHNKGLAPMLSPEELATFRASYPFWFNGDGTVKGKRKAHWTNTTGITSIETLATHVGETNLYTEFYHVGSGVAHGSPEIWRLFIDPIKMGIDPIAGKVPVYKFALCSSYFLMMISELFGDYFVTNYSKEELAFLRSEHTRLSNLL